jgi:hypothetical protein
MTPSFQSPNRPSAVVVRLPSARDTRPVEDEVLRELRDIWPSTVDLAKKPGTLFRLHAILNG